MPDLMHLSFWPFILILSYPVLAIAVLEFATASPAAPLSPLVSSVKFP